jgi:kumamolisin
MRKYVELEGSERRVRTGDRLVGGVNRHATIRVTVHVKPETDQLANAARDLVMKPLRERQYLGREDYAKAHGASPSDLAKVKKFARECGLRVVRDRLAKRTGSSSAAHRTLELEGSVGAFSQAFRVRFARFQGSGQTYRGYTGAIQIPEELHGVVQNVMGLDTRPQAKPRLRRLNDLGGSDETGAQTFDPNQVAKLYNFPPGLTGKGQVIGVIELAGGYRGKDLRTYFKSLGIPKPRISSVAVAGGSNSPAGDPSSADGEVMLDIEVLGAVAPGASLVVYFARNTNRGFFRAINTAIHDNKHKPSILSISWGGPEGSWRASDLESMDSAFQAAAVMGITVCVASGDGGSSDGVPPGNVAHVDFPGSSPFVTACGGTRIVSTDGQTISDEVVWNDGPQGGATGGGLSAHFPVPWYQNGFALPASANPGGGPGRAVPDICGNASPWSGYKVRVDSVDVALGGTSAVAPLWAGLTALMNEGLQRQVGFLNSLLYNLARMRSPALRDIVTGHNDTTGLVGGYQAGTGYDACTGLGSPNGALLMNALNS